MNKYKVEIDDGTGEISWLDVEADDENSAADAACDKLANENPELQREMMVVIIVAPTDA